MEADSTTGTGSIVDELREGLAHARPLADPIAQPMVVGRSGPAGSAVVVDHPYVSRRHLGIAAVDGVPVVTDLGSRNGTWLRRDGVRHRVGELAVLAAGDRLETLDAVVLYDVPETDATP